MVGTSQYHRGTLARRGLDPTEASVPAANLHVERAADAPSDSCVQSEPTYSESTYSVD